MNFKKLQFFERFNCPLYLNHGFLAKYRGTRTGVSDFTLLRMNRGKDMIEKATIKDALMIAKMAIRMWTNHTLDELIKEFEDIIENKESAIFLLSINNQVVGFAQCQIRHDYVEGTDSNPVGYLEGIYVEQEFRHKGYAKELLTRCEEWAKEKGCAEFASDCELDNKVSLGFHLNMGFTEANRIICFTKQL